MWNLEEKAPVTDWERRIDELMARQIATLDEAERKTIYNEVQKIFYEHQPIVYFVRAAHLCRPLIASGQP
jgi:ABC-type transport system substrate-binding protein